MMVVSEKQKEGNRIRSARYRRNPKNKEKIRLRRIKYENTPGAKMRRKKHDKYTPYKYLRDRDCGYKRYHSDSHQDFRLKKEYGISIQDYKLIFEKQKGRCKICTTHQSKLKGRLCVDHDHKTGKIRGLLCRSCNLVLGNAKDSIENLQSAILYLKSYH